MGHLNSHLIWHKYAEKYFTEGKKNLEIGPAGYPTYYEKELKQKGINTFYKGVRCSKRLYIRSRKQS